MNMRKILTLFTLIFLAHAVNETTKLTQDIPKKWFFRQMHTLKENAKKFKCIKC